MQIIEQELPAVVLGIVLVSLASIMIVVIMLIRATTTNVKRPDSFGSDRTRRSSSSSNFSTSSSSSASSSSSCFIEIIVPPASANQRSKKLSDEIYSDDMANYLLPISRTIARERDLPTVRNDRRPSWNLLDEGMDGMLEAMKARENHQRLSE
jgi:hypothetical protein